MYTIRKAAMLLALITIIPAICFSQQDSARKKNELSIGVNFQSKLHYFGRTDSLQSSALLPNIGFQLKNGLYIQSNFIFIQNKAISTTYAGTTIEGGYRFKASKHFNGNIFYTQILYRDKSQLPQSALKGQAGFNLAYTNSAVNINGGADLKLSDQQSDIGATLGLDHIFIIHKENSHVAFAIDPSFYAYAGTQRFSRTSVNQKSFLGVPVSQQQVTETSNKFNILSYEASIPLVMAAGKFFATVIPGYVIPQNLLQGENGKNLFYVTLGVGVKF